MRALRTGPTRRERRGVDRHDAAQAALDLLDVDDVGRPSPRSAAWPGGCCRSSRRGRACSAPRLAGEGVRRGPAPASPAPGGFVVAGAGPRLLRRRSTRARRRARAQRGRRSGRRCPACYARGTGPDRLCPNGSVPNGCAPVEQYVRGPDASRAVRGRRTALSGSARPGRVGGGRARAGRRRSRRTPGAAPGPRSGSTRGSSLRRAVAGPGRPRCCRSCGRSRPSPYGGVELLEQRRAAPRAASACRGSPAGRRPRAARGTGRSRRTRGCRRRRCGPRGRRRPAARLVAGSSRREAASSRSTAARRTSAASSAGAGGLEPDVQPVEPGGAPRDVHAERKTTATRQSAMFSQSSRRIVQTRRPVSTTPASAGHRLVHAHARRGPPSTSRRRGRRRLASADSCLRRAGSSSSSAAAAARASASPTGNSAPGAAVAAAPAGTPRCRWRGSGRPPTSPRRGRCRSSRRRCWARRTRPPSAARAPCRPR